MLAEVVNSRQILAFMRGAIRGIPRMLSRKKCRDVAVDTIRPRARFTPLPQTAVNVRRQVLDALG
jgi:hypothetical protein